MRIPGRREGKRGTQEQVTDQRGPDCRRETLAPLHATFMEPRTAALHLCKQTHRPGGEQGRWMWASAWGPLSHSLPSPKSPCLAPPSPPALPSLSPPSSVLPCNKRTRPEHCCPSTFTLFRTFDHAEKLWYHRRIDPHLCRKKHHFIFDFSCCVHS